MHTLREHLGSPGISGGVRVALGFSFLCCCVVLFVFVFVLCLVPNVRGRRGRDHVIVGFTTTYVINAYHH